MPPEGSSIDVRGTLVQYQRVGLGEPLLYLHGSGGAGAWDAGLTALAQHFDFIAPCHPGFGPYERPDWMESIHDYVIHYLDFMDALELERCHLVGTSMGGWMAAELAVTSSHRLASLTLIDAAGLRVEDAPVPDIFAMTRDEQIRIVFHDQALADQVLSVGLDDASLAAYLRNQETMALLTWDPYMHDPKLPGRLHRISVPTLVLWGAEDRLIPVAHGRAYANAIPHARLEFIDNCGHIPHEEQAEQFTRLVGAFLREHGR